MSGVPETRLQPAYVLHYRAFRDTSFIVDLFSLHQGRMAVVARGARGPKSRTRALFQPFRPLLVSWTGQGELRTLTGIEESGAAWVFDNRALACAYYINELVLRLAGKEQPLPELFGHYAVCLQSLSAAAPDTGTRVPPTMEASLRQFEMQLLEALGLLPDLVHSAVGGEAVEAGLQYHFYPDKALSVPLTSSAGDSMMHDKQRLADAAALDTQTDCVTPEERVIVHGRTLLCMARLDFSEPVVLDEARQLMRRLLRLHLGGKPLNSRSLFATLVRGAEASPSDVP